MPDGPHSYLVRALQQEIESAFSIAMKLGVDVPYVVFAVDVRDQNGLYVARHFAKQDQIETMVKAATSRGSSPRLAFACEFGVAMNILKELGEAGYQPIIGLMRPLGHFLVVSIASGEISGMFIAMPSQGVNAKLGENTELAMWGHSGAELENIWVSPVQSYPCVISAQLHNGIEVYLSTTKVNELSEGYVLKVGDNRRLATIVNIRDGDDFETGMSYIELKWEAQL